MSKNANTGTSATLKGIIAVLSTLLVVVIIVLVSAKVLFVGGNSVETKKTGRITVTDPLEVTTTVKTKATKKTTKSSTTTGYNDLYSDDLYDDESYTTQTVISAVYLHPEPTSASENLCVIPVGAECKVYKNENGWLYLDYNGQMGYAYYTFFTE